MTGEAPLPPPKVDPESLAIRARPAGAIRFRRGLIIGVAAIGSASLFALSWASLAPRAAVSHVEQEELAKPATEPGSEALARLPSTYGDVPQLGRPLPGDLGRPILEHQRRMEAAGTAGASGLAENARERRGAERDAARQSALLVSVAKPAEATTATGLAAGPPGSQAVGDSARLALAPDVDPNAQQRKTDFVAALPPDGDVNPHRIAAAPSPYLLSAGSVISASLITGLRSDLPGLVTAQVSENVFDSPTGRLLLIPQGARLFGSYDSVVAFGQRRALVVWQRIIWPDGSSMRLDNVPATDPSGYAGLEGKVDFHSWSLLKGVAISTLLGVSSELMLSGQGDLVQAVRRSTQDSAARAGDQLISKNLGVQPTIMIRPGATVRLVVNKDLILMPWKS